MVPSSHSFRSFILLLSKKILSFSSSLSLLPWSDGFVYLIENDHLTLLCQISNQLKNVVGQDWKSFQIVLKYKRYIVIRIKSKENKKKSSLLFCDLPPPSRYHRSAPDWFIYCNNLGKDGGGVHFQFVCWNPCNTLKIATKRILIFHKKYLISLKKSDCSSNRLKSSIVEKNQ